MRELERDLPTSAIATPQAGELPTLAIVGAGRVGSSLARAAKRAGLPVTLPGREEAATACRACDAVLLCVPDTAIADAAATVAEAVPPLRFVGHTSGATTLAELAPAAEAGAETFSIHPLQTIPDAATELDGCPCAIAGSSADALEFARALAERLGMRPFEVPDSQRAAYHAAASIASNFLIALEESATSLLEAAGIEDPRELLAPLVLRTAANWAERGGDALTGPIARGDEATVARHLEALRGVAPELVELYEALAARAREMAR